MIPAIGEKVFAFQHKSDRVGETMFLMSTQEHCTKDYTTGLAEALEELCITGEETLVGDEDVVIVNPDEAKNLIVWEMKRIR